jgi:hypothetical protein
MIATCPPTHVWVARNGEASMATYRFHRNEAKGRLLYRRDNDWPERGDIGSEVSYAYAAFTHAVCPGCGGLHERQVPACTLCGATL